MATNGHQVQQHNVYPGHFKPDVAHYAPIIPQHNQYHTSQQQDQQFSATPANAMQANTDIEFLLQIHRRKMIRRAANRRSAQQSRARKKALMGDLKIENLRLQKFADILDSQPELTFCIDKSGQITFMSDSALNFMKSSNAEDNDDDPTHISQILTGESVGTVLDCVAQIRADQSASNNPHGDHDGTGFISSVQSVCYHDAGGFQVAGYIRCSRLIKRAPFDDGDTAAVVDVAAGPATKKSKTAAPVPLTASNVAAASSSSGLFAPAMQQNSPVPVSSSGAGLEFNHEDRHHVDTEEEFVCAIRPADASFPHSRDSQLFSSLLSTASIVAHDLELRSGSSEPPLQPYGLNYSQPIVPSYEPMAHPQSHQPIATSHSNPQGSSYPYQTYGPLGNHTGSAVSERGKSNSYLEGVGDLDDQPL